MGVRECRPRGREELPIQDLGHHMIRDCEEVVVGRPLTTDRSAHTESLPRRLRPELVADGQFRRQDSRRGSA
jgi:hypothetical protein